MVTRTYTTRNYPRRQRVYWIKQLVDLVEDEMLHADEDIPNLDGHGVSDHLTDEYRRLVYDERCTRCKADKIISKIRVYSPKGPLAAH